MKQSISIFLFFWICGIAYSQNPKVNILRQDLSGLFDNLSMIGNVRKWTVSYTGITPLRNTEINDIVVHSPGLSSKGIG